MSDDVDGSLGVCCPLCERPSVRPWFLVRGKRLYQCSVCDAGFRPIWSIAASSDEESQRAAFDRRYVRSRQSIRAWLRMEARRTLARLKRFVPPPCRIIEVGCSSGELGWCAVRMGYLYEGVEPSPAAADHARFCYGLFVRDGTFDALPEDGQFDAVVAVQTIEHVRDPLVALGRARRALRPGGIVFIEVPSVEGWELAVRRQGSAVLSEEHLFFHSRQSLAALLRRAGFSVLGVRSVEPYAGIANAAIALSGIGSVMGWAVRAARTPQRAAGPIGRTVGRVEARWAAGSSWIERLIDAGRFSVAGASILTGIALTPLRAALVLAGMGGALVAIGRAEP